MLSPDRKARRKHKLLEAVAAKNKDGAIHVSRTRTLASTSHPEWTALHFQIWRTIPPKYGFKTIALVLRILLIGLRQIRLIVSRWNAWAILFLLSPIPERKFCFESFIVVIFDMAGASGKNDNFRRTWDREEYEKKAKERALDDSDDEDDSSSKRRPSAPVKRELLKRRGYDVDLEANLGKSVVITKTTPLSHTGGYYCNVCDCVVKDSVNFLDHINGKKHQRNLGMSMRVERSSLDQVKKRFEMNKRKREEEKQKKEKEYDLEERMAILREEVRYRELTNVGFVRIENRG